VAKQVAHNPAGGARQAQALAAGTVLVAFILPGRRPKAVAEPLDFEPEPATASTR
jgi:hypothetical protein